LTSLIFGMQITCKMPDKTVSLRKRDADNSTIRDIEIKEIKWTP